MKHGLFLEDALQRTHLYTLPHMLGGALNRGPFLIEILVYCMCHSLSHTKVAKEAPVHLESPGGSGSEGPCFLFSVSRSGAALRLLFV